MHGKDLQRKACMTLRRKGKCMKLSTRIRELLSSLDTIEKKSFWTAAPAIAVAGIISLLTAPVTYNSKLIIFAGSACVIFPIVMMFICYKTRDYHFCYPVFCIGIGACCIPITFLANGGFNSGMPIVCTACTITCAFIYDKKWRMVSFAVSFLMNLFMFWISKNGFETLIAVNPDSVEEDIILCYVLATVGIFSAINMILTEVRHYVTDAELLNQVMDTSVRRDVIERTNKGLLNNEGVRTKVTVLFVDISRFTSITEKMTPEVSAKFLNTFLTVADRCIHENHGILDKFIGDCALAYWMDPEQKGNGITSAIRAVFDIQKSLYRDAEEIFAKFSTELDFSAGIDYGDVVIGSIGSDSRKDFTIIGDAVNTASRLQGLASKGELLISNHVYDIVGENLDVTPVTEEFYLRGKNSPLVIYHVNSIKEYSHEERHLDAIKAQRRENHFLFHVCGCRGSFPVSGIRYSEFGGETSCYIIRKDRYALVIDCGSGLGNAKQILKDCDTIDILLTHVHYDHILGLLNMSVFPKGAKMTMYAHFGGWLGMNTVHDFLDEPYWPINLINVENVDVMLGLEYEISDSIKATFYKADHPNNGTIIRLIVNNRKVCIFADLEDPAYIDPSIAYESDLLLYDGMYDDEERKLHEGWGHSTWQEAARYAASENVKRLVVTHHNPENADHALQHREDLAKKIFSQTIFARTGDIYII